MKADILLQRDLTSAASEAARAEALGLDGFLVTETKHDAFLPLALAAAATSKIEIGTSIAIALARTPMTTATSSYDLQRLSGGRVVLGLGSQIRPHITNRYGMPWSKPAARMREYVCAMHAIWDCWQHGTKLDFRGDFYTHTLMTPMFDPGPVPSGNPKVLLAAVGALMTEAAGEVADGLICHPFSSVEYLRAHTLPAVAAGRERAGRNDADFEFAGMVMLATGRTEAEMQAAIAGTRRQIAFYASTPAYRPVLEQHGWGALQEELNALSKRGEWDEMGRRITDDVLGTFAIVAEPEKAGALVRSRFGGLLDRVSLSLPYEADEGLVAEVLAGVRTA
ncbi:TIGR03617 family F420-dependent LLM class oxidoreductase [Saccharopolyspora elongata]|uniref:TIGR03617 family F420-dependent LLM class oxidoreductase n=1 Tax=Saccharopolyspora elongata TaxID=2530387 RepID=A0A4R4Z9B9_9PSEU|nr:TIGR03617 family F420-dependent LLM class oxidoreductase [Saccharopolyspora elongata]TDD52802.1 TIGR03617 family F420-dependent LLM class oxidoreductase [Saccharopolyspora elongata]